MVIVMGDFQIGISAFLLSSSLACLMDTWRVATFRATGVEQQRSFMRLDIKLHYPLFASTRLFWEKKRLYSKKEILIEPSSIKPPNMKP